jgi:uncharacterized membrane protein HdeD (DUF308 family)
VGIDVDVESTNPKNAPPQRRFNQPDSARVPHTDARTEASVRWCLFLLYGIAVGLLGLMLVGAPLLTPLTARSFMGVYWFILAMLAAFVCTYERSIVTLIWSFFICISGLLSGIAILQVPIAATAVVPSLLIVVLGTQGLILGVLEVTRGSGSDKCVSAFVLAAINLAFGVLLLQSAFAAAPVASVIFGALLLVQGLFLIVWACMLSP